MNKKDRGGVQAKGRGGKGIEARIAGMQMHHFAVACPRCGAVAAEPCRWARGHFQLLIHVDRVRAMKTPADLAADHRRVCFGCRNGSPCEFGIELDAVAKGPTT